MNGPFDPVEEFDAEGVSSIRYSDYIDMNNEQKYYKLGAYNECDEEVGSSNLAGNILFHVSSNGSLEHHLTWSEYQDWLGDVDHYDIYRVDDDNNLEFITTTYISGSFDLDIKPLAFEEIQNEYVIKKVSGNFCYIIKAVEGDSNPYGIKGNSKSNMDCVQEQVIYNIPEAFTPDNNGDNDVFKPYILFADPSNYTFIVYDRWGEPIFTTHDPTEGWTGRKNDKAYKEGTYAYYLQFSSSDGKVYTKKAMFHLIMP